jgi:hypothetical protein
METQCIQEQMVFQQLGRREVIGRFDGGRSAPMRAGCYYGKWRGSVGFSSEWRGVFKTTETPSGSNIAWRN